MPAKEFLESVSPAGGQSAAPPAPPTSPRELRHDREGAASALETSCRRTVLAYEPRPGEAPIQRIAVEFDESGQWVVVVDGVLLGEHPSADAAIEYARWLERAPLVAARHRDGMLRKISKGLTSQRGPERSQSARSGR